MSSPKLDEKIIKAIESYPCWPSHKVDLLLVLMDLKPATEVCLQSEKWRAGQKEKKVSRKRIEKFKHFIKKLKLLYKIEKEYKGSVREGNDKSIKEWVAVPFLISKNKQYLDLLERAIKRDDDELQGQAFGYPVSAIKAYCRNETIAPHDIPLSVRINDSFAFSTFGLSKDNWRQELKIGERWAKAIREVSPPIYNEYLSDFYSSNIFEDFERKQRFVFHGRYTERQKRIFIVTQIRDLLTLCRVLKVNPEKINIVFKIFDRQDEKIKEDPYHSVSQTSARFEEMALYRVWRPSQNPSSPHEITHLVAHQWGKSYFWEREINTAKGKKIKIKTAMLSTRFMQEGLAMAIHDMIFQRKLAENKQFKTIDDWCLKNYRKISRLKLKNVINIDGFASLPSRTVVPFAASFSKYLLENFGLKAYKKMYGAIKEIYPPAKNVKIIERVYGTSVDNLMKEFLKYLKAK